MLLLQYCAWNFMLSCLNRRRKPDTERVQEQEQVQVQEQEQEQEDSSQVGAVTSRCFAE